MSGMTAAILGAAAIGGVSSISSGALGSKAAGQSADSQVAAAALGAGVQRDAAVQGRIDAYPWALAGANALYAYMGELGVPMPKNKILPDLNAGPFGVNGGAAATTPATTLAYQQPAPASTPNYRIGEDHASGAWLMAGSPLTRPSAPAVSTAVAPTVVAATQSAAVPSPAAMEMTPALGFQETPGYQFQVEEGEKGVLHNLAALGMKNSGSALKALTRFRTGLADQTYDNYLNRLAGAAGMGQSQVQSTNNATQTAATNIAQSYTDQGAARASGYVGQANAWQGALGNLSNTAGNALGWAAYNNNRFPSAPGGGLY